jgi:hypothetical protein
MSLTKTSFSMIQGAVLNVLDFGADPTGVADSTTIIQTAIDQGLATNTPVFIPAGEYRITSVITLSSSATPFLNGVKVFGAGSKQSVLKCYGTAFIQSNQTQVNDNIQVFDLSVIKATSTAQIGMDIGTVRLSTFTNVVVNGFTVQWALRVNQGVANWWNRFYNCEGGGDGVTPNSVGWLFGNDGTNVPTTGLPNISDLDYNVFYGCKSFSVTVGIMVLHAIGCVVSGHQNSAVTTALQVYQGSNNDIELNAELVTNMGFAQGTTIANTFRLYNDGRLAADFVDSGVNHVKNQILGQPSLSNPDRLLDCFVRDRLGVSFTAASQNIFQIAFSSVEVAVTVTTTSCGYIVGTSEFASVQVWDITRTGGGAFTVTPIRTTGTSGVLTATAGSGNVTFAMAGNASAQLVGQTVVNIQGCGVVQTYPFMQNLGYLRV